MREATPTRPEISVGRPAEEEAVEPEVPPVVVPLVPVVPFLEGVVVPLVEVVLAEAPDIALKRRKEER